MQECDFRHIVRLESVGFFHCQFRLAIVRFQDAEELSQLFFRAFLRHEQQTPTALVDLVNEDIGSPIFWTSHEGPEPRLLNPSGAFNDPFYPQIRVKNRISERF